ncbi:MAG: hypothetical protein ACK4TG_00025 [Thermaurantiacus sp.]
MGNVPNAATVTISVADTDMLAVDNPLVSLAGAPSPCHITFAISDAGYVFPSQKPTGIRVEKANTFQSGYGITILGPPTTAFGLNSSDWQRSSDGRTVTITAQNPPDGQTFNYMITIQELASGRTISLDPRIADRAINNRAA